MWKKRSADASDSTVLVQPRASVLIGLYVMASTNA